MIRKVSMLSLEKETGLLQFIMLVSVTIYNPGQLPLPDVEIVKYPSVCFKADVVLLVD